MARFFLVLALALSVAGSLAAGEKTRQLSFTDHTGRAVSECDYAGKYQLIFFGYTHCPDVCPTDLQVLARAVDALGPAGAAVRPIFISFDPARDTPPVLAEYVANFHPRLIGLTGTRAQISAAAKAYRVIAEKTGESADGKDYLIDHTAQTYLIGPTGEGLEIFDHGTRPQAMAQRIRRHLEKAGADKKADP